ncbi:MAG: hypothetical protein MI725_03760 [Pirellulales bacterium]|nr:hypothetical protein [Pirellulales bacterium]
MSESKSPPISHPVGVLHDIRWSEICPWLILVRSLRVSLLVRVLLLAWVGVVLTQLGWAAIDRIFSDHPVRLESITGSDPRFSLLDHNDKPWYTNNSLVQAWHWLGQPFIRLAAREGNWLDSLVLTCSGIWGIAVWSFFGGAISRIAALHLARGETIGPVAALQAAVSTFPGTAGAPLIAFLGAAALAAPLVLAGMLVRLDLMLLLTGLAWVFVLAWGLMLAVVLLGLLFGWPLMWSTLAVERSDAFDAVSRTYAYVYQRPLQLLFYLLVVAALGFLGEFVVYSFASAAVHFSQWAISWGAGNERTAELVMLSTEGGTSDALGGMAATGAKVIFWWKWNWMAVAAAYPVAYLWSSAAGIYFLLRRHVDATEMDEIALSQQEQLLGVPDLESNNADLPEEKPPG